MVSSRVIAILLATAVVLLVAIAVTGGVGWLLYAGNDSDGGVVMGRLAQAGTVLFAVDVVLLLLALGVNAIDRRP